LADFSDQFWRVHELSTEEPLHDFWARATAVQVYFIEASFLNQDSSLSNFDWVVASELADHGMLHVGKLKEPSPASLRLSDRLFMQHLGIKEGVASQHAGHVPEVGIGHVDHGRDGDLLFDWVNHSLLDRSDVEGLVVRELPDLVRQLLVF